MRFAIEIEKEKDGRWIAEIPQIPGTMAYGRTPRTSRVTG
jgi:predicted RNase H-like HicB family nuclease